MTFKVAAPPEKEFSSNSREHVEGVDGIGAIHDENQGGRSTRENVYLRSISSLQQTWTSRKRENRVHTAEARGGHELINACALSVLNSKCQGQVTVRRIRTMVHP